MKCLFKFLYKNSKQFFTPTSHQLHMSMCPYPSHLDAMNLFDFSNQVKELVVYLFQFAFS